MLHTKETDFIEFKSMWKDEYLKTICGLANARGGRLFAGVDDNGKVVGIADPEKLLEEIPNKVTNLMGVVLQVELKFHDNLPYLILNIPESALPVSLKGKYYMRSGTTTQELNGSALYSFIYRKQNITWDEIGIENATFEDIDPVSIHRFVELAIAANRLSTDAAKLDIPSLFENLHLLDESGHIRKAALLSFAKEPIRFFPSMFVKIGRFITDTDIIIQDVIEDNLFVMVEKILAVLKSKYLKANISYKGIHRQEQLEYPENALREAILNAVVHRDYTGVFTQIRVNNSSLDIWNAGQLPFGLKVEMLYGQHASVPRNRTLAGIFFRAGYIEAWGRGTVGIVDECKKYGLPIPVFTEEFGGFSVSLKRDSMQEAMQDTMQEAMQDTINDERVVAKMKELLAEFKGEMTREELQNKVKIKNRDYFRLAYIIPALENGLIEMIYPEKPRSKFQKYQLTSKGISEQKNQNR